MGRIFLSYRRDDSLTITDAIFRWLQERLPEGYIFRDLNSTRAGESFASRIENEVANATVILAIMGVDWRGKTTQHSRGWFWQQEKREKYRIDDPQDWVRQELLLALQLNKPIIPLLVNGALFPEIPDVLRALRSNHGLTIQNEPDFEVDMIRLAHDLPLYDPELSVSDNSGDFRLIHLPTQRYAYLDALVRRYNLLSLPVASGTLPLNDIYQELPLKRFSPPKSQPAAEENEEGSESENESDNESEETIEVEGTSDSEDTDEAAINTRIVVTSEEILEQNNTHHILIFGGPGTGKTTMLRHMLLEAANIARNDASKPLPLYLSLPTLANTRAFHQIHSYLTEELRQWPLDSSLAEILTNELTTGHIFLCLDGLDEVLSDYHDEAIDWITQQSRNIKATGTIIISSRFAENNDIFIANEFSAWGLRALDDKQREKLAERLISVFRPTLDLVGSQETAQKFITQLQEHPQAGTWKENPLLFSLAAYVSANSPDGELPASRTVLYGRIVDGILTAREPNRDRRESLRRSLAALALRFYETRGRDFTRSDLYDYLPLIRSDLHEIWELDDMIPRILGSGLVDLVYGDVWSFRHQTFLEYLVAYGIAFWLTEPGGKKHTETEELIRQYRFRSRWVEPLRLMVGVLVHERGREGQNAAHKWLQSLATCHQSSEGDPGYLALGLALRSLSETIGKEADSDPLVKGVLTTWYEALCDATRNNHRNIRSRLLSIAPELRYLPESITRSAIDLLLSGLHDTSEAVCRTTAQALGYLGASIDEEQLQEMLIHPQNTVRLAAIFMLAYRVNESSVPHLLRALEDHSPAIQGTALHTLRYFRRYISPEQWKLLVTSSNWSARMAGAQSWKYQYDPDLTIISSLFKDTDRRVRAVAVRTFGYAGAQIEKEQLQTLLVNQNWMIRQAAVTALGNQGGDLPIDLLVRSLRDHHPDVRLAAIVVLGRQRENMPINDLLTRIHEKNWRIRRAVIQALGNAGTNAPLDVLLNALGDESQAVRRSAAQIVGKFSERQGLPYLQKIVTGVNHSARIAAIQILGAMGEQGDPNLLISMINDSNPTIRILAIRGCGNLESQIPLSILTKLLEDLDATVRQVALQALGNSGENLPTELMERMLHDHAPNVRVAAIQIAATLGQKLPLGTILRRLTDSSSNVRQTTLKTLNNRLDELDVDVLLPSLQDKEPQVQETAATIIGHMGSKLEHERIVIMLAHKKNMVRLAAVIALGYFEDKGIARNQLLSILHDPDWKIRRAVVSALVLQNITFSDEKIHSMLAGTNTAEQILAMIIMSQQNMEQSFPYLLQASTNDNWRIREVAIHLIGDAGNHVPIETLLTALNDSESLVRQTAIEALEKHASRIPIDFIESMLYSQTPTYRRTAIQLLRYLGQKAPVELLIQTLGDPDAGVRLGGAEILMQWQPERLIQGLTEIRSILINHDSPATRNSLLGTFIQVELADIIGYTGHPFPPYIDHLADLLEWPHWHVQLAAIRAVNAIGRGIPKRIIQRLYEIRSNAGDNLRKAADEALATILSGDDSA
jgi:HEAT repeat protein